MKCKHKGVLRSPNFLVCMLCKAWLLIVNDNEILQKVWHHTPRPGE